MPPAKLKLNTTLANIKNNTNHTNNDLSSNTENTNFNFVNSSLHSADKKLHIKDSFATSASAEEGEDDVFNSGENQPTTKLMLKKQEALKLAAKPRAVKAAAQQQPNAIKRRTNYSLNSLRL